LIIIKILGLEIVAPIVAIIVSLLDFPAPGFAPAKKNFAGLFARGGGGE